jgi:hypothetical protein
MPNGKWNDADSSFRISTPKPRTSACGFGARVNRQNLYRTLSNNGNPTWQSIEKIFDGLVPIPDESAQAIFVLGLWPRTCPVIH